MKSWCHLQKQTNYQPPSSPPPLPQKWSPSPSSGVHWVWCLLISSSFHFNSSLFCTVPFLLCFVKSQSRESSTVVCVCVWRNEKKTYIERETGLRFNLTSSGSVRSPQWKKKKVANASSSSRSQCRGAMLRQCQRQLPVVDHIFTCSPLHQHRHRHTPSIRPANSWTWSTLLLYICSSSIWWCYFLFISCFSDALMICCTVASAGHIRCWIHHGMI